MIPVNKLIALFQQMNREHWAYEWGVAKKGTVDCSGAFSYAFRQFGESIYQGSNRIARTEIVELLPIGEAKPGMAAFKRREPSNSLYDLPSTYRKGGQYYNGDLNDYYHIGLVDDDPRYVLNAQSAKTGFVRSALSQNWIGVGYLKKVDYGGEKKMMYRVIGGSLRLRKSPEIGNNVLSSIPNGEEIESLGVHDEKWAKVKYKATEGYVDRAFLEPVNAEEVVALQGNPAETLYKALKAAVEAYEKAVSNT